MTIYFLVFVIGISQALIASVDVSSLAWAMNWDSTNLICTITAVGVYASTLTTTNSIGISLISQASTIATSNGD